MLAAVNAEIIAQCGCPLPSAVVDDASLASAFGTILFRCATDGCIVLARYSEDVGGPLDHDELSVTSAADLSAQLVSRLGSWRGKGGCCLFCYSCVLTRGLDAIQRDVSLDHGMTPLISVRALLPSMTFPYLPWPSLL